MWIERLLADTLTRAAAERPAVLVTGARQTGKSSLIQRVFPEHRYVTLDATLEAAQAGENPAAFLDRHGEPVVIDEVQYAPELFRELKIRIDRDRSRCGRFILTGSQTFPLMSGVRESLAGRLRLLTLSTLAAEELLCDGRFSREEVASLVGRGGYPELWTRPELDDREFLEDYVGTYLERDLRRIVAVREIAQFRRFLGLLGTRVGNLLNYADLSRTLGTSANTVKDWIAALEVSGLVFLVPPWFENLGKRLTKSPKLYFTDTGLARHLAGLPRESLAASAFWGAYWENFVMSELLKRAAVRPGRELFFYRDHNGLEVDAVISGERELVLLEIKGSPAAARDLSAARRVAALLGSRPHRIVVAAPIDADEPIDLGDHRVVDPRFCRGRLF